MDKPLCVAYFRHVRDNVPVCREVTWSRLCRVLSTHTERAHKDGALWSPTAYQPDHGRGQANVLRLSCLVADVDSGADYATVDRVAMMLADFAFVIHSSHSHTEDAAKFRVVTPLAEDVPAADWGRVWDRWQTTFAHLRVKLDPACKDPSRIYYLPSHPPGAEHFAFSNEGSFFEMDFMPEVDYKARTEQAANPAHYAGRDNTAEALFLGAVRRAKAEGDRNNIGNWLAYKLKGNGFGADVARAILEQYVHEVGAAGSHPYTLREAQATLKSVYGGP